MGLNVSVSDWHGYEVTPYGPADIICKDRYGCGGPVQPGNTLQWCCNHSLHYKCGTVTADVMVVYVHDKQAQDGTMHIENIVRTMFQMEGDLDTTEPCWMPGSIEQNQRDL